MPLIHTEAITLRRRRIREADVLVTLFTKDRGKITTTIKSAVKTNSRFAGVTQPFNHLHVILYAKTEMHEVWTLTQSALIQQYQNLQLDVNRIAAASCIAEWVDGLSTDFNSARPVWTLLIEAFSRWDEYPPRIEDVIFYQFHLLIDAGLLPEVSLCMSCASTSSSHWVYHAKEGGIFCRNCSKEGLPLSNGSLQAIRFMLNQQSPPTVRLSETQYREISQLLNKHLEFHAEFSPKSHISWEQFQQHIHANPAKKAAL